MTADEVRATLAAHVVELVRTGELTAGELLAELPMVDAGVVDEAKQPPLT